MPIFHSGVKSSYTQCSVFLRAILVAVSYFKTDVLGTNLDGDLYYALYLHKRTLSAFVESVAKKANFNAIKISKIVHTRSS